MTTEQPPPSRGEATRARLVDAAASALASAGYHGTSYSELIASSGLSKGAYYHYFPSKQELALAVYRDRQERVIQASTEAVAGVSSPLARLLAFLRVRARLFARDRTLQCLPRLSTDFAALPELAGQAMEAHSVPLKLFGVLLEEAQKAGEIRKDLDPAAVARVLFSALVGINELSERESRSRDHEQRTEELISVFVATLEPPAKPRTHKPKGGSR